MVELDLIGANINRHGQNKHVATYIRLTVHTLNTKYINITLYLNYTTCTTYNAILLKLKYCFISKDNVVTSKLDTFLDICFSYKPIISHIAGFNYKKCFAMDIAKTDRIISASSIINRM